MTTCSEKQTVIFHVKGYLLFSVLSLVWVALGPENPSDASSHISARRALTGECAVKVHLTPRWEQAAASEMFPLSTGCFAGRRALCPASTDEVYLQRVLQC